MESVAIGTDGVRTRLALLHQALSKETLQQCRQTDAGSAHGRSSQRCCSRSIASRISSGEPSKYHCVSPTCTWPRQVDNIGRSLAELGAADRQHRRLQIGILKLEVACFTEA